MAVAVPVDETEDKPEVAAASGISGNAFRDIIDWEPRQVQTLDTMDACGKDDQYLSDSFIEFLDGCFASQDPPMLRHAQTLAKIRIMEDNVKDWREKRLYLTKQKDINFYKDSIFAEKEFIKKCKTDHKVNVAFFRQQFFKSTPTTIMGLACHTNNKDPDKHKWVGKFQYQSNEDATKIITEQIPVTEELGKTELQGGICKTGEKVNHPDAIN